VTGHISIAFGRLGRCRHTFIAMLALAFAACPSNLGVTSSSDNGDDETLVVVLLTTAAGSLSTTGGVLTTVGSDPPTPSLWVGNRRQIEIDIARGHGDWVDDLASEFSLPEGLVRHLGLALKRQREALSSILSRDPLRIDEWERTLGDALCCDPWLHPFAHQRFKCREPGEGVLACVP